ncbi:MAG: PAS domain-containing sensor histidine kinase, partial [Hymenobacter sp.]
DVQYRTIGAEDKKLRWVRAKGKAYFDTSDRPTRFIGSVLDITEQKQDELRKNDFISMVSHELKTPLTSLTAIVQMLQFKMKPSDDPAAANPLDRAVIQLKKMSALIGGFLNVSRLESGKIHLDVGPFNLGGLITEITEEFILTTSSARLTFLPCREIVVAADRDKIGTVIANLLSNAVKYSPQGSFIEVSCEVSGSVAKVSIKDQGMGISPQNIGKLFDRYYRVEGNSGISGFGIGLYLCAEIIQRHDGRIWADSKPGEGSVFCFELPFHAL